LKKIIADNLPPISSHVNNSFEVYNLLGGSYLDNYVITSFDMISLFTNVPLDLALEGLNRKRRYIERAIKISMSEFLLAV